MDGRRSGGCTAGSEGGRWGRGILPILIAGTGITLLPGGVRTQEPPGAAEAAEAAGAQGVGPVALTLEQAVERATVRNEDVLIARTEKARAEGLATEVRARTLPELSLDVGYTRNLQTPVLFFGGPEGTEQVSIGNDNEYLFGLSLEQPLVDFSLGPARAAARLSRTASDASVEAARVQVALETRLAYYQVLLDRALVRVQEQALEQAQARLAQVEAFQRAGTASEFDLLTAQVEVDNIRPQLIEARNRLALDRNRLKRIVDLPLDAELTLADSLAEPGPLPSYETVLDEALRERADLESQRLRVRLQEENFVSEERSVLPTLSLTASLQRRASSNDFVPPQRDFTQSASAGVMFSLPLFDGRSRAGRIQQAAAEMERESYRLHRFEEDVRLEAQQAYQNLEAALQQIDASEANVRRAERALEIAQTRFSNGLGTQVELNDAELAVTRARTNFVQARYDYNVARARLDRAAGRR